MLLFDARVTLEERLTNVVTMVSRFCLIKKTEKIVVLFCLLCFFLEKQN